MSEPDRQLCETYIRWGVLPMIGKNDAACVSTEQFARLRRLLDQNAPTKEKVGHLLQLFPSEHELMLSSTTGILRTGEKGRDVPGGEVLTQLLPRTVENAVSTSALSALGEVNLPGQGLNVLSKDPTILSTVERQVERFSRQTQQREKLNVLARSANYMGAKTLLCPAICELVEAYHPRDGVVLDLMCGSGATAGAFAQRWKVYASDAQTFSRHLALIQGGGMNVGLARTIMQQVTSLARSHFDRLADLVGRDIEKEEGYLMSELTAADCASFITWATDYPKINSSLFNQDQTLVNEINVRRINSRTSPATLFTRYYANLFFGVRQAAEIDSLRIAIEALDDVHHRKWALGALICAVSACADNYGGHFAQPRFDTTSPEKLGSKIKETLLRRTMSVTQEFSARLISLALESQTVPHMIEEIEGPWQQAILHASKALENQSTLVYLDPPYTRDEYSRYYHVLETLIHYNYPVVGGKAAIPTKGTTGRFASEFFTRSVLPVEETIAKAITACLENKWSCLWSYSSSGVANIERVIHQLGSRPRGIDIYKAKYAYKPQGKRPLLGESTTQSSPAQQEIAGLGISTAPERGKSGALNPVDEYMIMICA